MLHGDYSLKSVSHILYSNQKYKNHFFTYIPLFFLLFHAFVIHRGNVRMWPLNQDLSVYVHLIPIFCILLHSNTCPQPITLTF